MFPVFLSGLACQSLKPKPAPLKSAPQQTSPVIDKNYFEIQADTAYLKGEEAFFNGDSEKALTYFKKALLYAPQSSFLKKRLAAVYQKEDLLAEALKHYQALLTEDKNNKIIQQKIRDIYLEGALYQKAFEQQKELLRQDPKSFAQQFKYALLLMDQKNWTRALKGLKRAEALASYKTQKVKALLPQVYILKKLQKPSQALKILSQLDQIPIATEDLALGLANSYKILKKQDQALSYLEDFQKTYGITPLVSQSLLSDYISLADWDKSLTQIKHLEALGQLQKEHYFYIALVFLEQQKPQMALPYLKDLSNKEPKNGQYLYLTAMAYEQKQDWLKALKIYSQVRSSSSHFLAAKLQSARLFSQIGETKKAFTLLKSLSFTKQGGISPQALLLYAETFWNQGETHKALEILTKGLKKSPMHADLLFLRGFYLKELGLWEPALEDMNLILKKYENHSEALNFVATFYSEQKIQLPLAEKLARKAVSLEPDSSYFLNTLGWIFFQQGDLNSSLDCLKTAFLKNNTNSRIAKRLGTVYLQLKDFEKSDYFFKEALRLKQHEQKLKTKNKRFKQAFIH